MNGQKGRTVPSCHISSKALEPWLRYGDFSIFQDSGRRHLGILFFKFSTVGTIKKVELHQCAKFCQNRSYRGPDMAIFNFPRWRPPPWIFEISNF